MSKKREYDFHVFFSTFPFLFESVMIRVSDLLLSPESRSDCAESTVKVIY